MKCLITGRGGQVGAALIASAPPHAEIIAASRAELDLADPAAIDAFVQAHRPDLIINAAAYTAVDRAESEAELAFAINRDGAGRMANAAQQIGARFVHISTDFVFDGTSALPYAPDAPINPLSVYGQSKVEGEQAVRTAHPDALIVRTAWVYAAGGRNFVETMLRLMAGEKPVRVVGDQIGSPTHAASLARALWALVEAQATGTLHYTDAGTASWYDFAVAIADLGVEHGLLPTPPSVVPITTADYPTPAVRPACSVLEKSATWALLGGPAQHWRHELSDMLLQRKTDIS